MTTVSARQLYLTLLDMDEHVTAPAALERLYRAYAQTRMSEAGILIDLDAVCGSARPLDGLG